VLPLIVAWEQAKMERYCRLDGFARRASKGEKLASDDVKARRGRGRTPEAGSRDLDGRSRNGWFAHLAPGCSFGVTD